MLLGEKACVQLLTLNEEGGEPYEIPFVAWGSNLFAEKRNMECKVLIVITELYGRGQR